MMDRKQLDAAIGHGCEVPGCTHEDHEILFLHARCHVGGKIEVSYRKGSGVLRIGCRECGKLIANVGVKEG